MRCSRAMPRVCSPHVQPKVWDSAPVTLVLMCAASVQLPVTWAGWRVAQNNPKMRNYAPPIIPALNYFTTLRNPTPTLYTLYTRSTLITGT